MYDRLSRFALMWFGKLLTAAAFAAIALKSGAAELEPRAYSNIPVGQNFIVAGYAYMSGGVGFSPTVPIKDAHLQVHNSIFAFARSLDIWGKSGKFDVIDHWMSGGSPVSSMLSFLTPGSLARL
jgi:hypothetical protein